MASRAPLHRFAFLALALAALPARGHALTAEAGAFAEWHPLAATNELGRPEGLDSAGSSTLLAGLRFGVGLLRGLQLELEGTYGQGTLPYAIGATVERADVTLLGARLALRGALDLGRVQPFALVGGGIQRSSSAVAVAALQDTDGTAHFGAGVALRLVSQLHLRLDGRYVLTGSTEPDRSVSGELAATLGLAWQLGGADVPLADADSDRVPDEPDRCPFEAETHNGVRDGDGCPEHPEVVRRYHRTRYMRDRQQGVVATLTKKPPAPVPSVAPAKGLPRPATAAAAEDGDDPLLKKLDPPLPLAQNALPPLVSGGDDDGDGLARADDVCPSEPEDKDGFEDGDGCPDPDDDGDGVPDGDDRCPFEAELINDVRDHDGCPEDPQVARRYHRTRYRRDRDGAATATLQPAATGANGSPAAAPAPAPREPDVLAEAVPLAKGALPPLVSAGDDDGDGLARADDVCPSEAEDADGFEDGDGCPDPDDDDDGLLDAADRCRQEGETRNGFEDGDGCPDSLPKPLLERVGRIDGLVFAQNSARILEQSEPTLAKLLDLLQRYQAIVVEIGGHTDDSGNRDRNKMLSSLRAEAVRAWLVSRGVPPARVTAQGYGPDKPVASNRTPAGRAANRRVEFQLVVTELAAEAEKE